MSRRPLVERRRTTPALAAYTFASIAVGSAVLAWATVALPLLPQIGSSALPDLSADRSVAGLVFWIAVGLLGSVKTSVLRHRGMLTFHLPFIVAAMVLGGPVAAGWVAAISTLERRELREVPWFGILANHAVEALAAVVGGLVLQVVSLQLSGLVEPHVVTLLAALAGGYVFAATDTSLCVVTVALKENLTMGEGFTVFERSFRETALGEILLGWVLALLYVDVAWWAPVACAVLVVLLWQANDEHESAREDPLTGLLNRKGFDERWDATLDRVRSGRQNAALVAVDLDGFKAINDTHGHTTGDAVIRATADRMRAAVRYSDTVARSGGDEFLLILAGVADVETARSIAERVHQGICAPIQAGEQKVSVGASLGVLLLDGGPEMSDPLRLADRAMYRAKVGGGGIELAQSMA